MHLLLRAVREQVFVRGGSSMLKYVHAGNFTIQNRRQHKEDTDRFRALVKKQDTSFQNQSFYTSPLAAELLFYHDVFNHCINCIHFAPNLLRVGTKYWANVVMDVLFCVTTSDDWCALRSHSIAPIHLHFQEPTSSYKSTKRKSGDKIITQQLRIFFIRYAAAVLISVDIINWSLVDQRPIFPRHYPTETDCLVASCSSVLALPHHPRRQHIISSNSFWCCCCCWLRSLKAILPPLPLLNNINHIRQLLLL